MEFAKTRQSLAQNTVTHSGVHKIVADIAYKSVFLIFLVNAFV
jgi:hypothetical protein